MDVSVPSCGFDWTDNRLPPERDAKRQSCQTLLPQGVGRPNTSPPLVINVDKKPAYIGAVRDLKQEHLLPAHCKRRPSQYMNINIVEQDHRFMKRKIDPRLGFGSYPTAWRTIQGYETMHMVRKGQIEEQNRKISRRRINSSKGSLA